MIVTSKVNDCQLKMSMFVTPKVTVCHLKGKFLSPQRSTYVTSNVNVCLHTKGIKINILRQWTTGPPTLRIWWSGLKSGGPENYSVIRAYTIHFHLKVITERVQLIITDS